MYNKYNLILMFWSSYFYYSHCHNNFHNFIVIYFVSWNPQYLRSEVVVYIGTHNTVEYEDNI